MSNLPRVGDSIPAADIRPGYVIDLDGGPFPVERRDEVNGYTYVSKYPARMEPMSWRTVTGSVTLLGYFNPETTEHVDYPHEPGRLFDCEACEAGPCVCNPETDAPCVSRSCVQDLAA